MNTEEQRERLRWRHKPFPELARLAWPITVSMLSFSTMTLVDTLFVGRLGASALAGVGLGGVYAFTLLCFGFGLLRSVKVLTSQAVGAGRKHQLGAYLGAGLVLACVLGGVNILVGYATSGFLLDIAATVESGVAAQSYADVRLLGAPLVLLVVALRENSYGVGHSTPPMRATLLANGVNVCLDYVFVIHLDLGVAGVAWASLAAQGLEVLVLAYARRRAVAGVSATRVVHVVEVWRLGVPMGLQMLLEVGSFAALTALLASFGETDVAAHQVALQVCHLAFLPAFAVGEAASVLAGQAVGANERQLVRRVARLALVVAGSYSLLCGSIFAIAAWPIARMFGSEPELLRKITHLLYLAAAFLTFDAVNIVARSVLRGAGDVRFPAVVNVAISWACLPPLTWVLGHALGLGAVGGWIGLTVEIVLSASVLWWRLERGSWNAAADATRERLDSVDRQTVDSSPVAASA